MIYVKSSSRKLVSGHLGLWLREINSLVHKTFCSILIQFYYLYVQKIMIQVSYDRQFQNLPVGTGFIIF